MPERGRLSLWVGLFVVASLVVGALAVLFLGARGGILNPRYRLVTYFDDVQGLVGGAPVRLAGRDVGSVEFVSFAPLTGDLPPVRVVMQVDESIQDRVRSDSVARIATIGLLGDKYVEITMGTAFGRVLKDGDELASVSPLDLGSAVARGTEAIDNIATLAENVNRVVAEFGEAMGGQKLATATGSLTAIVSEIQDGDGLLHSLIYDRYEAGCAHAAPGERRSRSAPPGCARPRRHGACAALPRAVPPTASRRRAPPPPATSRPARSARPRRGCRSSARSPCPLR